MRLSKALKRFDDEKLADGEISNLVRQVLPLKMWFYIELKAPIELEVISYRKKVVVEGKSYVAKVATNNNSCVYSTYLFINM